MTDLTPDELIEYLKTTSTPTVLVEGTGDVKIYRWLENYFIERGYSVSVLQAGARRGIFKIHDHKDVLARTPIVFTADLDDFLFTGVPIERKDIVFTSGYSIENDVIEESELSKLMNSNEKESYERLKRIVSEWFASEVEELRIKNTWKVGCSIHAVIDCKNLMFKQHIEFSEHEAHFIHENFSILVRGKNLVDTLLVILSDKKRIGDKYSSDNIISISITFGEKAILRNLAERVMAALELEYRRYGLVH